jgi:hypothetical protein
MNRILAKIKPERVEEAMLADTAEFKITTSEIYSEEEKFLLF